MPEYTVADIVARRRKLAEEFAVEQRKLKERFQPKLDTLDNWLLSHLLKTKQKSISTDAGTVMTYMRRNVKMTDLEALRTWCEFNELPEFIKESVDSTEVLAYLDADKAHLLPDGLKMDSTEVLAIRAPS